MTKGGGETLAQDIFTVLVYPSSHSKGGVHVELSKGTEVPIREFLETHKVIQMCGLAPVANDQAIAVGLVLVEDELPAAKVY